MRAVLLTGASFGIAVALLSTPVRGQRAAVQYLIATSGGNASNDAGTTRLQALDAWIGDAAGNGSLQLQAAESDVLAPGRYHERYAQFHRGVRVFGGDVVRQTRAGGQPVSVFGAVYPDIGIGVTPVIASSDAPVLLASAARGVVFQDSPTELLVLPHDGVYDLTWSTRVFSNVDGHVYRVFIDAITGNAIAQYDDTQTQVAIDTAGRGVGVAGDSLKIQAEPFSGGFRTIDLLTPGRNSTYDMGGDPNKATRILNGLQTITDADAATDADNTWSDQAVASTQAYGSLTYRYYSTRLQRNGLNNQNLRYRLLQNPARVQDFNSLGGQFPLFFNNAAYYGNGYVAFGVGGGGNRNFAASIDVVAHELSHGVTAYTSNLIYQNESGALNESFSDMMGVAVEFMYQQKGAGAARSDWLQGEDIRASGQPLRSLSSPSSLGFPDHYSIKSNTTGDNGGVHTNSSISNHAFYLAIEGGVHRLSGVRVEGVGWDEPARDREGDLPRLHGDAARGRDVLDGARGDDSGGARSLRRREPGRAGDHAGVGRRGSELMRRAVLAFVLAVAVAAPAAAQTPPRAPRKPPPPPTLAKFLFGAGIGGSATSNDFEQDVVLTLFAEEGSIRGPVSVAHGPLFDVHAGYRLWRRIGVGVAVSLLTSNGNMHADFNLPDPFLVAAFHAVGGDASATRTTTDLHVSALIGLKHTPKWHVVLSVGPSVSWLSQQLGYDRFRYTYVYPFDDATLEPVEGRTSDGRGIGVHAGLAITRLLGRRWGIEGTVRGSSTKVELDALGRPVTLQTGGLQMSAGIRFHF